MVVYLFVVIQIYNKFSGFLLFFTIIYNLSLEMSDEPKRIWLVAARNKILFGVHVKRSLSCYNMAIKVL